MKETVTELKTQFVNIIDLVNYAEDNWEEILSLLPEKWNIIYNFLVLKESTCSTSDKEYNYFKSYLYSFYLIDKFETKIKEELNIAFDLIIDFNSGNSDQWILPNSFANYIFKYIWSKNGNIALSPSFSTNKDIGYINKHIFYLLPYIKELWKEDVHTENI